MPAPAPTGPRGTTPAPAYVLLVDADIAPETFAAWYAYDLLAVFGPSALGQAFGAAYAIAAPEYRGWARAAWPAGVVTPDQLIDGLVVSQQIAVDARLLVVCLMTPAHSQIPPTSNVLAYHSATATVPYLWVPYYASGGWGFSARDLLTFALVHEWMEAVTDTWPGQGLLPCGQEVGDPCEAARFELTGSQGDAYLVQGFALPGCGCWQPASATFRAEVGPLGAGAFHPPGHLRERVWRAPESGGRLGLLSAPPPGPPGGRTDGASRSPSRPSRARPDAAAS